MQRAIAVVLAAAVLAGGCASSEPPATFVDSRPVVVAESPPEDVLTSRMDSRVRPLLLDGWLQVSVTAPRWKKDVVSFSVRLKNVSTRPVDATRAEVELTFGSASVQAAGSGKFTGVVQSGALASATYTFRVPAEYRGKHQLLVQVTPKLNGQTATFHD